MSVASISLRHGFSIVVLFAVASCGGKMSDDAIETFGTNNTFATTWLYSAGGYPANGSYVLLGGAYGTGGVRYQSSVGSVSSQPTYGGSRPSSSGSYSPAGGIHASGGKPFGGAFASGGIHAGGRQATGGRNTSGGWTQVSSGSLVGGASAIPDVCMMHEDPGSCYGYMPKYFFNVFHGRCELFIYGGCGGNANRFDTLAECEKRCNVKSTLCPSEIPETDEPRQCDVSSVCYYQDETECPCKPGYSNTYPYCAAIEPSCDQEADASTPEGPDAGTYVEPAVIACTCGSPYWNCRFLRMIRDMD